MVLPLIPFLQHTSDILDKNVLIQDCSSLFKYYLSENQVSIKHHWIFVDMRPVVSWMVRTVLYTNKASKINCLPCTDLISLTARLDLLPHIMQQIPKDQSNRSTERVIFWSGRRERDVGCSDSYSNITASSKIDRAPGNQSCVSSRGPLCKWDGDEEGDREITDT